MEKRAIQRFAVVVGLISALQWLFAAEPAPCGCLGAKTGLDGGLDHSKTCLSCHDGAIAPDVIAGQPSIREFGREGNHPVMISYERAYYRAPSEFFPPPALDESVKLVNGEVHCVSCHAASATGQWVLAKPNDRSALCLSCHRK